MMSLFAGGSFNWPKTVYLGVGSQEAGTSDEAQKLNERYVAAIESLAAKASTSGSRAAILVGQGHVHNEPAWAERFPEALKHLYGKR